MEVGRQGTVQFVNSGLLRNDLIKNFQSLLIVCCSGVTELWAGEAGSWHTERRPPPLGVLPNTLRAGLSAPAS